MLLDDYWERMNLTVPIYFSAGICCFLKVEVLFFIYCIFLLYVKLCLLICSIGLTIQANMYYKMLIGWTSQKIKDSHAVHNPFDFKHGMVGFFKSY